MDMDTVQRAANLLGVDTATIRAVAEIESLNSGFLTDGRPVILFESHVFSRETDGRYDQSHPDISTPKWDRRSYGSSGPWQYNRLNRARNLDDEAALKSASWGAFQIMGFNHRACGYPTVHEFVDAMYEDEDNHLFAFCQFVRSNMRMLEALRAKDWAEFARRYNGPGYRQNSYDTKLKNAYEKHARLGN